MKLLVCAATKYGATGDIAQAVADLLAAKGLEVTVIPPDKVGAVQEFDAVVLGSAVYMGQWLKPARELAERQAAALAARPVWLFSSGPVGEPARPADNPVESPRSWQPPGPAATTSSSASWQEAPQLPRPGHGLRHPRPGGRLPQLGRDQGMGGRHRRHPAYLMPAAPASGQTRTIAPVGCCNSP
jgi:hypothetical protein